MVSEPFTLTGAAPSEEPSRDRDRARTQTPAFLAVPVTNIRDYAVLQWGRYVVRAAEPGRAGRDLSPVADYQATIMPQGGGAGRTHSRRDSLSSPPDI